MRTEWQVARVIVNAGWCARCQRTFAEHLKQPHAHNYEPDLTEPIAAALLKASQRAGEPGGGG